LEHSDTVVHASVRRFGRYAVGSAAIAGLYLLSRCNYLLFHMLVETASVAVVWGVFLVVWNARRLDVPADVVTLGMGYLAVGWIDLLHALAYEGMNLFGRQGADLATQLWIAARGIETVTLFLFALGTVRGRYSRLGRFLLFVGSCSCLVSIFIGDIFPGCFHAETGLTAFKKYSEYMFIAILGVAISLAWRRRAVVGHRFASLFVGSIAVTIASGFLFTFYASPFGSANMIGHLLKVASFALLYRAIIVEGIERPLETLGGTLRAETERRARIIETATDGFLMVDMQGRICEANESAAAMLGYTRTELLEMGLQHIDVSEQPDEIAEHLLVVRRDGRGRFETKHRRSDGSVFDVEVSCSLLAGADPRVVAFVRDIADRKRWEVRLRNQAAILAQVSDAVIATDLELRITSWNAAAERIYGWTAVESVGNHIDELLETRWLDEGLDEARSMLERTGSWKGEVRQRSKDGRNLTIEASVSWIRDVTGVLVGGVTVNRDVTGRREAQELLERSEERYRSVVKALPDLCFRVDTDLRIVDVHATSEMLDTPIERIIGRFAPDVFLREAPELTRERVGAVLATGKMERYHCTLDVRNTRREYESRMVPGGVGEVVVIIRDVTELRQLQNRLTDVSEREQQKIAQELHDGICQDLKSLEIEAALLEDSLVGTDAAAANRVAGLGQRINGVVRGAYSLVRGMMPVGLDAEGFATSLQHLVDRARTKGAPEIKTVIFDGLAPRSAACAYQLYRIAQEALENALRHAGASRIIVRWTAADERMILSIRDDGTGIAESGSRRDDEGMGIPVMRSRAEAIGAVFEIRSGHGTGTEVTCVLTADASGRVDVSEDVGVVQ
jgi:PAS domain S-box-containing protein